MTINKMMVEIWSDVTCPFCYTGKRKFESALSQFKDSANIEIVWKSFELAPGLKTDPNKKLPQFLAELKGTSLEQAEGMTDHVSNSAKQDGLVYNLKKAIPANSFNAHRLSHLAKHHDLQDKAEENLLKAYFTDGKNIDDIPTLIEIGREVGLDTMEIRYVLESNQYADEVRQDILEAQRAGVRGVPFFVFNGKLKVSGAQNSNAFLEALEKAFAEWRNENPESGSVIADGPFCKIGEDCK
jgi:predicted DsbA family dithiol-disulfide isomerase